MCFKYKFLMITVLLLVLCSNLVFGQEKPENNKSEYLISIYQVAPGQHLEFLNWMAAQEAIAREAGAPAAQWYAHLNGDSWDYLVINKQLGNGQDEEIDRKIDELAKKKGVPTGMKAGLKFRQFMNSHTDTYVLGPFLAEELVKAAGE